MSTVDLTVEEMSGSLTGFEEQAIKKNFGVTMNDLGREGTTALRALVFADQRRKGAKDRDAYNTAMEMPLRDCQAYFAEEETEVDPDDPETDQGKDG